MAELIGPLSMIKKSYNQLYRLTLDLTSSLEEVLLNVTHQAWVTFMPSEAVSGPYKA